MKIPLYMKLKELRQKNGLSQAEVANSLNISRQAISQWETGKVTPDIDNLILLSKLYDISIDELLETSKASNKTSDNFSHISNQSVLEKIGLFIILIVSSQFPFLGLIVAVGIPLWMFHTKRNYKLIYLLSVLCFILSIYNTYIMIDHLFFNLGTPGIEKI